MNCPMKSGENVEYLLDYAAGKLNAELHAQMDRHMETCPACREFAGGQNGVWQVLDSWQPAAISPEFDRKLYERIEQDVSWWTRFMRQLKPVFGHMVPVAAAAGVMLVAGLIMYHPAAVPVAPAQKSAQIESLQPEEVATALDDMEMLREFSHLVRPDNSAEPKM